MLFLPEHLRDTELIVLNILFPYFIIGDNIHNIYTEIILLKKLSKINKSCNNYVHLLIKNFIGKYDYNEKINIEINDDKFLMRNPFYNFRENESAGRYDYYSMDLKYFKLCIKENRDLYLIKGLLNMLLRNINVNINTNHIYDITIENSSGIDINIMKSYNTHLEIYIKFANLINKIIDMNLRLNNLEIIKLFINKKNIEINIHSLIKYIFYEYTHDKIINLFIDNSSNINPNNDEIYGYLYTNDFTSVHNISSEIRKTRTLNLIEKIKYNFSYLKYVLFY